MMRSRNLAWPLAAAMVVVAAFVLKPSEAFDRELFLSDYARLKQHLSEAYANLEWVAVYRGLDLRALDANTIRAIEESESAAKARDAIRAFVRSFHDPHFYAEDLEPSLLERLASAAGPPKKRKITSDLSARKACNLMGYGRRDLGFDLQFESQPGFKNVRSEDGNPFHAGTLELTRAACSPPWSQEL